MNGYDHCNALFGLITEGKITIEPKGRGVYQADNYLNTSVLSNNPHFLSVGPNARKFFIPTVSIARLQDFNYFGAIQEQLDKDGYQALLFHLMHEVDLTGSNVRDAPKTAGWRSTSNTPNLCAVGLMPPVPRYHRCQGRIGTLYGNDCASSRKRSRGFRPRIASVSAVA